MLWSMVTDNVDMKLDHIHHMVLDGDEKPVVLKPWTLIGLYFAEL